MYITETFLEDLTGINVNSYPNNKVIQAIQQAEEMINYWTGQKYAAPPFLIQKATAIIAGWVLKGKLNDQLQNSLVKSESTATHSYTVKNIPSITGNIEVDTIIKMHRKSKLNVSLV